MSVTTASTATAKLFLARYKAVRQATRQLCAPLSPEDLMVQSCPEASPVKWHLAHTSWFFETFVLREFLAGYKPFHPDFHWLFNSYYNSLGDMPEKKLRASFSRPHLDAILAYRTHVDASMINLLQHPLEDEAARRITLGLSHEQQHQELIATDIKHALFTNPLHPAYIETTQQQKNEVMAPPIDWVTFNPGLVEIGLTPDPASTDDFAFDNETPRHSVYLAPFRLATRPVTCAEYLAFIDQNGYNRPELWLSEGWTTIRNEGWEAPLYWQHDNTTQSGWCIYTLHGFQPLEDLSETPVCHLSFFEADAYARWAGHRLPTEFEWEHAATRQLDAAAHIAISKEPSQLSIEAEKRSEAKNRSETENRSEVEKKAEAGRGSKTENRSEAENRSSFRPKSLTHFVSDAAEKPASLPASSPSHETSQTISGNFLETGNLHPTPATSREGLQQLFGDVWEWTQSGYTGYPGYKLLPGALGEYNGKFMSSQIVLRGGSCVTPATHIRPTYRNFFTPATRWQFTGLRLAQDITK